MQNNTNYLQRFGKKACLSMVWKAIPWGKRLMSFPFCASVYIEMFSKSSNIDELRVHHIEHYAKSFMFRLFRPKFRDIKRSIKALLGPTSDSDSAKASRAFKPIPWRRQPLADSSESDMIKLLYERIGQLSMQLEHAHQEEALRREAHSLCSDEDLFAEPIGAENSIRL